MYINLHLHRILRHTKPVVPKLKIRQNLNETKGYLTSVIPGIVSIDHVHCQSKSMTIYSRLHLPVNARAQNMFSRDVKLLSFRCQTLKFSRPNVKFPR